MGFKYVLVPASASEDLQELQYHEDIVDLTKDTFRESVEKFFSGKSCNLDKEILLKQLQEKTGVDMKEHKGEHIDRLLMSTSVEIFPLMVPTKATQFQAISVYCDDKGIAKGLEPNVRMSGLAFACGYPSQTFMGDCFIGRVFDDTEDEWRREDFSLADMSTDAAWCELCKSQRSNKSPADLKKFADTVGAKNPAIVNGDKGDEEVKGETETYCWRQAKDEVELTFKKEDLQKGDKKLVKVTFGLRKLRVEAKGEELINADLFAATVPDEATWTLSDGVLQVTLTKATEETWPTLLKD